MIPRANIIAWSTEAPWPTLDQVEQDLLLSRLMIEIAGNPMLGSELTMRGGTCFHKLRLSQGRRYSEDLDYVRRSAGGIKDVLDELQAVASTVGFAQINTTLGNQPKVLLRDRHTDSGNSLKVKIEINTHERSPARPIESVPFAVHNDWFTGTADVSTFILPELIATKIRALYQRKKGRDLFDLWLAVNELGCLPTDIADCFETYRPTGWTVGLARTNLERKLADRAFRDDLLPLINSWPDSYSIEAGVAVAMAVLTAIEQLTK